MTTKEAPPGDLWTTIREQLDACGVDLEALGCCGPEGSSPLKVVCVSADMRSCLDELGRTARDQVLMVRVDTQTLDVVVFPMTITSAAIGLVFGIIEMSWLSAGWSLLVLWGFLGSRDRGADDSHGQSLARLRRR